MTKKAPTKQDLLLQVEELRSRLEEAEDTLRAIRTGEVDALVVSGPEGEAVYTLKGAEHSYRVILETMNEGVLSLSGDGTVLYCNARFAELVKTPIEQVIGGSLRRLVAPADQPKLEALMALSSGKAEMTLTASDGTRVPSQLSTRFLQEDGWQATCVVVTDLTEIVAANEALRRAHDELGIRMKERTRELARTNEELEVAEEELRSQNEELLTARQTLEDERQRYQDLFEFAPDGDLVTDPQGIIQEANRAAVTLLGVPPGSLLGKPLVVFVDEAHTPLKLFYTQLKPLLLGEVGSIHNWELVLEPEDRAPFPAAITVGPVGNTGGEVTGLRWLVRDVTDRKRAEEEIASLARFPSENPNPVLRLSQDGAVLYANEASKSLLQEWECGVGDPAPSYWRGLVAEAVASRANKTVDVESGDRVYSFFVTPITEAGYVNLYGRDITDRKRAEEALQRSEALYRAIARNLPDSSVYVVDLDGRFLVAEGVLMSRLGEAREQLEGRTLREAHDEQTLQLVEPRWLRALSGKTAGFETAYRGRMLYSQYVPLRDESGRVMAAMALAQDITERKKREQELHRLNRTLRAHSHSDQALMRATIEAEYMQEVCGIIVQDCGHAMVWIGFAEDDEGKTVRPVAYAGFEEGYLDTLHITWADAERGRGPTGTAVRTGKPSFCRNMLTDPQFAPWRAEALKRGYASSLVLPLLDEGRAFGALTIYFREPDPFSEDEVTLLSGLADDLAYGIRTIRLRTARAQAEQALRQSEERYRSLFEGMTEGFALHEIICDEKGEPCDYRFLEINPSFERLTGLTREGVVGKTHNEVLPDDDPYWVEIYGAVALTGQPIHFENYSSALNRHYDVFAYCPAPRQFAVLFINITERKQAEEQLRETRDYLENLLNYANAPIIVWDPQFRITRFNHAFERLTGLDAAKALGQQLDILFPADRRDDALGHIRRALAGERWEVVEIPIAQVDGTVRTVLWNSATLYAPDGTTAVATIAQGQDITERKQMEEALRRQNEELEAARAAAENEKRRLEAVMEALPVGVSILDAQGGNVQSNRAFNRIWGEPRPVTRSVGDYAAYQAWWVDTGQLVQPEEWASTRAVRNGETVAGQLMRIQRFDGMPAFVHNSAAPILDAHGQIVGSAVAIMDITERMEADEQLRLLYRALEAAANGVAITNRQGRLVWVNPAFAKLTGYSREEAVGQNPRVLKSGQQPPEFYREMWQTILRGEPWHGQLVNRRKDGTLYTEEMTIAPVRGGGEITHFVAIKEDITERKKAEERLAFQANILANITDVVYATDEHLQLTSWNYAAEKMYGWKEEEVLGKNVIEVTGSKFDPEMRRILTPELMERGSVIAEIEHTTRSGKIVFFESNTMLLRGSGGRVTGFVSVNHDITERKRAEQERERLLVELDAEKARWQATVENMLDPVTLADARGHATYMNAAYSRMVERDIQPDLELGEHSNYYQLYRPDGTIFAPDELPLQHAALYDEPAQNVEIVQRDPAGGEHIAIWNAAPLHDPQGRVTGAVAVGRDVTEQRKAEIEREWLLIENRRQRQFLERLMEVAPVGIAVVRGPDHIYEFVNPYYRAIPGAPDGPMVGRSLAEVFPKVAAGGALGIMETAYRTGQTVGVHEYEATVGPGRGKTFWDVDSVPLYDTAGQVDSVLILTREVTEQVLARRQIEELAARDEAILDSMTEGLMIADLQGNVLSLNPAARRIHGHEISEDVDKPFLEFVPAFELCDSDGQLMASDEWPLPRVLRGETLQNLETLVRRTDTGQVRIVSYGGTLVRDKTGQPILSIVTSRDVTAQKEAEAERMRLLKEVQRRAAELDAVITSIADGVMIHDQAAGIVRMNPAAERILGYSPAERELSLAERTTRVIRVTSVDGQPINPEDMPVPRALRGQTVRNNVMSVQHWRTGNQVWVSMSAAPIQTPEGATLGAVSTLTDITELRQTQQSLEQANEQLQAQMEELQVQKEEMEMLTQELLSARDELELRVQERTEKLASTNQELQIASEQLREQNEELFVARQAVEAERKRYQDMFEFAPDGYLVTSPDGIIHEANRAAAALLHVSQGSLVGKPLAVYVAEQDRLAFYTLLAHPPLGADSTAPGESQEPALNAVIESRPGANEILRFAQNDMNSVNVELRMQPRQQAAFHAELTFAPVREAQGDLVGLRWLLRDISGRKRAEEALRLASAYNRRLIEASLDPLVTIGPDGKITDLNSATEAITGRSREELIGTEFLEYFTEPQKARAGYQQVFRDGLVRDYALEIRRRDGRVTPVLYNASVYRDDAGQVVGVFAAARDITERVQAYQLLEQRVQERTRELSTLLTISHQVASTLELSPLLSLILDQLKVMVDYAGLSILLLEGDELTVREYRGPYPRDKALQTRFSLHASVGGQEVISRREPVIIADLQDDSPLARAYRATTLGESMTFTGDARSWMGVPLIVKDQAVGMLRLSYIEPNYFTPHHAQLVLAIANQAAVAIENARLYEWAQHAAALEERQRLARELHDSVSQALYGIALGAHTALAMLDSDRTKLVEALNYVISLVGAAMTEMRALIFELRPESLQVEGLATALGKHAAALSARFGIEVDTELCEEPEAPLASKEAFYRIAQEALQNAVKHARPTRLSLQLTCEADSLVLQVSDDGVGFDPTASFPGHLGLRSMRERAARVGGTLEIESAPGRGTRLRACVPVRAA